MNAAYGAWSDGPHRKIAHKMLNQMADTTQQNKQSKMVEIK